MIDYLASLEADAAALADAARAAGLDAAVPTCPGWTVADLVTHTTGVFQRVEATVRDRLQQAIDRSTLPALPTESDAIVPAYEAHTRALLDALAGAAVDEPVYNWSLNQPKVAGFWRRRMAQEAVIHRWDAQSAAGTTQPVPADMAIDGIDELMDVFFPAAAAWRPDMRLDGSMHLHCTDVEGEWLVRLGDGVAEVQREHGQGDAAVRGPASDVLLFAWNRLDRHAPGLEAFGDDAVFGSWRTLTI